MRRTTLSWLLQCAWWDRTGSGQYCSVVHLVAAKQWTLARIIHERFCCNREFASATSLDAAGAASKQAGSSLGRPTYRIKYASLPRDSARLSRVAAARFRHEPSWI